MVLEIQLKKENVIYIQPGLWNININLTATDEEIIKINKNYSVSFRKNDSFDLKSNKFIELMQIDIDKYYSENFIYFDKDIDSLVTSISERLNLEEPTELNEVRKK